MLRQGKSKWCFLLGPTLMEYGTDDQKSKFLSAMAEGDHIWSQGWSEPNAGSDMAAIRATAFRNNDTFIINGQKLGHQEQPLQTGLLAYLGVIQNLKDTEDCLLY
ncbi:MAG: hypothetical protein CM15mP12_7500 [Gammaproteobacteria bacterium]|nr:MAG: hypothetical protein CM15mP12_7500 [Gammaproteobacteria bacterium]